MNVDAINPDKYDKRMDDEIRRIEKQLNVDIENAELSIKKRISEQRDVAERLLKESETSTSDKDIAYSLGIAVALSALVFFALTVSGISLQIGEPSSFFADLRFILPGGVLLVVLVCLFVWTSFRRRSDNKKKAVDAQNHIDQIDDIRQELPTMIDQLKKDAETKIENLRGEKARYRSEYEQLRRAESAKYADSAVAQEVIDMLANGFRSHIEASDRRPHVEEIVVPFSFRVYAEKIDTPYGVYDFELKRVARLAGMNEQAALANAIAQNVHTQIMTEYPVDPSGGEVDPLEITVRYGADWVEESMTYRAVNGLYVPERSF